MSPRAEAAHQLELDKSIDVGTQIANLSVYQMCLHNRTALFEYCILSLSFEILALGVDVI